MEVVYWACTILFFVFGFMAALKLKDVKTQPKLIEVDTTEEEKKPELKKEEKKDAGMSFKQLKS